MPKPVGSGPDSVAELAQEETANEEFQREGQQTPQPKDD
jgi:hypothetical protein